MNQSFSPNLFLFQSYVGQVLRQAKKIIKTQPFESLDPQVLLNTDKHQKIDSYHHFFLAAINNIKTRELACKNYQKLLEQQLIDRNNLPVSLISSVLSACASSGSTSGSSSLGSASLSLVPQGHANYIGSFIKTALLKVPNNTSQILIAINYLLQGTRKKNGIVYYNYLQEVYSNVLIRMRQLPLNRIIKGFVEIIIDQIQAQIGQQKSLISIRKHNGQKIQLALFYEKNGYGKFGKCFNCRREAYHYMKEQYLPICGLNCKQKIKSTILQNQSHQQFSLFIWILECLPNFDDIILRFLQRQLQFWVGKHYLNAQSLFYILQTLVCQIKSWGGSKTIMKIIGIIILKWQQLISYVDVQKYNEKYIKYKKTTLLQIVTSVQQSVFGTDKVQLVLLLVQLFLNQKLIFQVFQNYDAKFFQYSILFRAFDIINQYSKKFDQVMEGFIQIIKKLKIKIVDQNIKRNIWKGFIQFTYKKKVLKLTQQFNKKPKNGLKKIKKLFSKLQQQISQSLSTSTRAITQITQLSKQNKKEQNVGQQNEIQQKEQNVRQQKQQIEKQQKQPNQKQQKQQNEIQQKKSHEINQKQQKQQSKKQQQKIIQKKEYQSPNKQLQSPKKQQIKQQTNITDQQIASFIRVNIQQRGKYIDEWKGPIPHYCFYKQAVGQFFGGTTQQSKKICNSFLQQYRFMQQVQSIIDALRITTNVFRLPKQTQQIQRILQNLSILLIGKYGFKSDTPVYQYIYLMLMVQTSNSNTQVKQSQKLNLQQTLKLFKSMTKQQIDLQIIENDFRLIVSNPLDNKMKYRGADLFNKKYFIRRSSRESLFNQQSKQSSLIQALIIHISELFVDCLLSSGNNKGLFQAAVLLGYAGLAQQQQKLLLALKKLSNKNELLRLSIQNGNQLLGKSWELVLQGLYLLQQQGQGGAILDKLFSRSYMLDYLRIIELLKALLNFSTSQLKRQASYTRELFVIRQINSLLEYNLNRLTNIINFPIFKSQEQIQLNNLTLAAAIWNLLDKFFKQICLHPRKQVAMAAVDALKQIVLRLMKIAGDPVSHQALIQPFEYIFQRCGLDMKDLVANLLLNLITTQLRGGFHSVYLILDVIDTGDRTLVPKIVGRLIKQVGLNRLASLPRLHAICIKQLRLIQDQQTSQILLNYIWDISQFIDDPIIWLQTLRSIKDIFKILINPQILVVFVKFVNRCLDGIGKQSAQGPKTLQRQILVEVVDLFMFLQGLKSGGSRTTGFLGALDALNNIKSDFILKNLGGSCGLLSVYQLLLQGTHKIASSLFIRKVIQKLVVIIKEINQNNHNNYDLQNIFLSVQQLGQWSVNQFLQLMPHQLINLKGSDDDFKATFNDLIVRNSSNVSKQQKDPQLIQFQLSHKDYYQKCLLHLVFLDIITLLYQIFSQRSKIKSNIEEVVEDSYMNASKFNKLVFYRQFLWNNSFLPGKSLPGLLKQEHRCIKFAVSKFSKKGCYSIFKNYFKNYYQTLQLLKKAGQNQNKILTIYINDAKQWISQSKEGICIGLKRIKQWIQTEQIKISEEQEFRSQLQQILAFENINVKIIENVCEVLKSIYKVVMNKNI